MQRAVMQKYFPLRSKAILSRSTIQIRNCSNPSRPSQAKQLYARQSQREKTPVNPGVTTKQFQALFQRPHRNARVPKLRWDWHLRNFVMALIPPAVLFAFLTILEHTIGKTPEADLLRTESLAGETHRNEKDEEVEGDAPSSLLFHAHRTFEQRLMKLEEEIRLLRTEEEKTRSARSGQETLDRVSECESSARASPAERAKLISRAMSHRRIDGK